MWSLLSSNKYLRANEKSMIVKLAIGALNIINDGMFWTLWHCNLMPNIKPNVRIDISTKVGITYFVVDFFAGISNILFASYLFWLTDLNLPNAGTNYRDDDVDCDKVNEDLRKPSFDDSLDFGQPEDDERESETFFEPKMERSDSSL